MIFVAVIGGTIFYLTLRQTKSILAAIIAHWEYNCLVLIVPLLALARG